MKARLASILGAATSFILVVTELGCTPSKPKLSEQEAVVAAFKQTIDDYLRVYRQSKHQRVFHEEGSEFAHSPEGWRKAYFELASEVYTVDVQKTNSLVTPYLGIFEFDVKRFLSPVHDNQESASQATDFSSVPFIFRHRHTYAYQDGKWVLKSRQNFDSILNEWSDCEEGE